MTQLTLGQVAPDFEAETTEGRIRFADWAKDSWVVIFSHPRDFTPVCTTELGEAARLKPEFDRRGVKIIGLSVDPLDRHAAWADDIAQTQGHALNFPMIADPDRTVSELYGMIHPEADPVHHRAHSVRARPRAEGAADADLPAVHGPQLPRGLAGDRQPAAHRPAEGGDAGELAEGRARHHRAEPVRRGRQGALPAGLGAERPYLRWVELKE
jgi:peroxiredoxin